MNQLATIADAVVTEIAGSSLYDADNPGFTVARVYIPLYGATENARKLFVVGLAEAPDLYGTNATRSSCDHKYTIQVAIIERVDAGDRTGTDPVAELDALSDFRESLIDLFKTKRTLTALADAQLAEISNPVAYEPGKLETDGVFMSVITLVYMLQR